MNQTKNEQMLRDVQGKVFQRNGEVREFDEASRTVELAFSSEESVSRYFGEEILDHSLESVDMEFLNSGRANLLADHDARIVLGVIEEARIDSDRMGRAKVRFGKSDIASEYFQDVVDGIRGNVSVGYVVQSLMLEEEHEDAPNVYRVTAWKPVEVSLVSIPADESVGVGRAHESQQSIEIETQKKERNMNTEPAIEPSKAPAAPIVDASAIANEAVQKERARTSEIQALGAQTGHEEAATRYISEARSVEEFKNHIITAMGAPAPISSSDTRDGLGLASEDAADFSFARLFAAQATGDWSGAKLEQDVVMETAKRYKGEKKFRGLAIPTDVLMSKNDRNLETGTANKGGDLIQTDIAGGSFIELLRNRLFVRQLGATVLTGLEGNLSIPGQSAAATGYWIAEGADVNTSDLTIKQVALSPKTAAGRTEFTRKMLLQSSVSVEQMVRNDLAATLATTIDLAALKGSGSGAEPEGIIGKTGVGTVPISAGSPNWGNMVALESAVATANADIGNLAYVMSVADRGALKTTEKANGTAQFIFNDGMVNGYNAYATNQLAANEIIFGNWQDVVIGEWGVLDVLVNPYTKAASGSVEIIAMQDVDMDVRNVGSFAYTTTS